MADTHERLFGTDGDDTIDAEGGSDKIMDFKDVSGGENDKIDLSSQGGGEIIIEDFTSSDLDATDFDFYTM